jgi:hypothetical protein
MANPRHAPRFSTAFLLQGTGPAVTWLWVCVSNVTTNMTSGQTENFVTLFGTSSPPQGNVCHARVLLHLCSSAADAGKYNLQTHSHYSYHLLEHPLYVPLNKMLIGFSEDR